MARLILDSGAVIALAAGNERARRFVQRAVKERIAVIIPAVVVAETTRGGPCDAAINRVIKSVEHIAPTTEEEAREAGRLLAKVERSNVTIDALVVATAARRERTIILTGDVDDITALATNYTHIGIEGV